MILRQDISPSLSSPLCCQRKKDSPEDNHRFSPLQFQNSKSKISLKRFRSKQSKRNLFHSPPFQQSTHCTSQKTLPLTPKIIPIGNIPKINFSWKKIQEKTQNTVQLQTKDAPSTQLLPPTPTLCGKPFPHRVSLVSIRTNSSKRQPKFEQSLIQVDYFHPDPNKMNEIKAFLEKSSH